MTAPALQARTRIITLAILTGCAITSLRSAEEAPTLLSPFEVRTSAEDIYAPKATSTGTIVAMPRDQIPFVTSILTSNMIEDLQLLNPSSFAAEIAGVSMAQGDQFNAGPAQLGSGTRYKVRGTETAPLYHGFQTGTGINQSPFAIDRVEITKGPNSIIYGQSTAGGTINFVPKLATIGAESRSATVSAGTNDALAGSFDIRGNLGSEQRAAVRFGGGYQENSREQQFYEVNQLNLYGAYRLNFGKAITLDVAAQLLRTKAIPARTEAFVTAGAGTARVTDPYNRLRNDRNFNYNGPWSEREGMSYISSAYLTGAISPTVTVRLGGFFAKQDQTLDAPDGLFGLADRESATGYGQIVDLNQNILGLKADILHQGEFFRYKVNSLLGYEEHLSKDRNETIRTATNFTVTIPLNRKPVASDWPARPNRSLYTVWSASGLGRLYWSNIRFTQIVTSPNENATVMWGLAKGEGTNKATNLRLNSASKAVGSDTTFTAGPTYRIFQNSKAEVTAFANYSTSFVIQGGNKQLPAQFSGFPSVAALRAYVDTITPNAIDPQTGAGFEVGVRASSKDGKVRAELTWFDQERENIARNFFVRESNVSGVTSELVIATYQLASGEERTKGAELALDWNPTRNLAVTASAYLAQGRVVANPEAPEEVGFELPNHPERMYNLWIRYSWEQGPLKGLILGAGASYNSATRTFPPLADRFRRSDAYTLGRLLVAYEFKRGKQRQKISVNVENALDQEFVFENGILSEPRIYRLTYTHSW